MKFELLLLVGCFIGYSHAIQAKRFVYVSRFNGYPKISDLHLEEETLPQLKDGGKFISFKIK